MSVAEGTGLGCPKLMGTAGIAQEEERMQGLPGNTLEGLMCCAVPLRRLWQGLNDIWDAEPEESPPLLHQGQLDPSPAPTGVL